MRRTPTLTLAFALAVATAAGGSFPAAARADEIVTKTGQKFTGRIIREDDQSYTIDTLDFGPTKIAKTDASAVRRGPSAAPKEPAATPDAPAAPDAAPGAKSDAGPAKGGAVAGDAGQPAPKSGAKDGAKPAGDEPLDAAARLEARKGLTIRRNTTPGAAAKPAPSTTTAPGTTGTAERTAPVDEDRQAIGGAQLAAAPIGTTVVVYEPPRQVAIAGSGVQIGRRTVARLDTAGRATARLAVTVAGKDEPWTLRLADVQRHIVVKSDKDRVRILEGIDSGDWVRVRTQDGVIHQGRLTALDGSVAKLTKTGPDGALATELVDMLTAVQIDGLAKSTSTARALQDAAQRDRIGVVLWPEGREVVGRVVEVLPTGVMVDTDRDEQGDTSVPFDGPVCDVRRIVPKWRDLVRDLDATSAVRVRCAEDFPDARVEREWTGMVLGVTAYAISVKTDDGAAVVPFEQVLKLEHISSVHATTARALAKQSLGLPVVPGDTRETLAAIGEVKGITALHDGSVVTHVWITAPWSEPVAGIRLDTPLEDALASSQVHFTTFVTPTDPDSPLRKPKKDAQPRELLSDGVDGLRFTIQTDDSGRVRMVELSRR